MPEPHVRASDADRAVVADVLGAGMSSGRLTVAEYDDRLARAYAARTHGQLTELTADLPRTTARAAGGPTPSGTPATTPAGGPWWAHGWSGGSVCAGGSSLRAAWTSWATTALIVVGIWVMSLIGTQGWVYPWPVWVIGPWGAVLLAQTIGGRDGDRGRAQAPQH